jgi:hypothetical protein
MAELDGDVSEAESAGDALGDDLGAGATVPGLIDLDAAAVASARELRRQHAAHHGPKPTFKITRGVSLLLVDGNLAFSSSLARLADAQGLALVVCWSLEELKRLPFTHFDGALVEEALWQGLQAPAWAMQRRYFDGLGVVVLTDGEAPPAPSADDVVVCGRSSGASTVLGTALAAAGHRDDHHGHVHGHGHGLVPALAH